MVGLGTREECFTVNIITPFLIATLMPPIAYFTAEIGLWSELHTYSGGLGVLAGDHVKSAADARLPLVAMSLLYREGYGRQHLDQAGDQSESYAPIDPAEHLSNTGKTIQLPLDGTTLYATVWKTDVVGVSGHVVPVYFLDTFHPNNTAEFVGLGARLYGGDDNTRPSGIPAGCGRRSCPPSARA